MLKYNHLNLIGLKLMNEAYYILNLKSYKMISRNSTTCFNNIIELHIFLACLN